MLNEIVSPMLLSESEVIPSKKNYIYELKYDGIRAIIYVVNKNISIYTRNKKDITHLFPELEKIKNIVKNNAIFDGEIICTKDGKPNFSKIQNRIHLKSKNKISSQSTWNRATFICFDILYYNKNLTNLTLLERRNILDNFVDNEVFVKSKIFYDGKKLFNIIKEYDLEGIVCKNIKSKYVIGNRTNEWIKVKNYKVEYFYVGGFKESDTNVFTLCLGEKRNSKLYYVGKVFVAKKYKLYNKLLHLKKVDNKFFNYDEDDVVFVMPTIKVKIRYIERTENNHLREAFYVSN